MEHLGALGNAISVVEYAYRLYNECFLVARRAPQAFQELKKEVNILRIILYRSHYQNDWHPLPNDEGIRNALRECKDVLDDFERLLRKYKKLASANRGVTWRQFTWIREQSTINDCRQKFRDASNSLQLALSINAYNRCRSSNEQPAVRPSTRPSSSKTIRKPKPESPKIENAPFDPRWYPSHRVAEIPGTDSAPSCFTRPYLSIDAERERHDMPVEVQQQFSASFQESGDLMTLDIWLCIATWWYLKSKTICDAINKPTSQEENNTGNRTEDAWEPEISFVQATADLLKSIWIVDEIILRCFDDPGLSSASTVDKLRYLIKSIDTELRRRRKPGSDSPMGTLRDLRDCDFKLFEPYAQSIEEPRSIPQGLDDIQYSPYRFMVADMEDACHSGEKVVYRKFVNARLGPHGFPTRSFTAPYMLLLSCLDGSSELFVSLINQHGTLNLVRAIYRDDFKMFQEDTCMDGGYLLSFPSLSTNVRFLHPQDRVEFYGHLRRLYEGLRVRNPRLGEVLICRQPLAFYETQHSDLPSSEPGETSLPEMHTLCEVSLYEHTPSQSWQTVRRLVICSSPSSNPVFCTTYWLPLSRVRVQRQDDQVVLSWSDCGQIHSRPDGEYGYCWSYIYNPDRPNRSINLSFRTIQGAESFADSILCPFDLPFRTRYSRSVATFAPATGSHEFRIFELQDLDEAQSQGYYALVSIKKRSQLYQIADVFFIHRDLDFDLVTNSKSRITFPRLRIPHYVSNIVDLPHTPSQEDGTPHCQDVVTDLGSVVFSFDQNINLKRFVEHITGWMPEFCRTVYVVHLSHGRLFRTSLKETSVQIWMKAVKSQDDHQTNGNLDDQGLNEHSSHPSVSTSHTRVSTADHDLRLAVRRPPTRAGNFSTTPNGSNPEPVWLTARLRDLGSLTEDYRSLKAVLKDVDVCEGDMLDSQEFQAVRSEDLERPRQQHRAADDESGGGGGGGGGGGADARDDEDESRGDGSGRANTRWVRKMEIIFRDRHDLKAFTKLVRECR